MSTPDNEMPNELNQAGYSGVVAEERKLENGNIMVGIDHYTMGKISAPAQNGHVLTADLTVPGQAVWAEPSAGVSREEFELFKAETVAALQRLLPRPVENPTDGDVLTAGADLLPHWKGSGPRPDTDTKWRDLYDPADKYDPFKALNSLEFKYDGRVRIRRIGDRVSLNIKAVTGKTTSGNPDLTSTIVTSLPGVGWYAAAPCNGEIPSSVGPVRWELNATNIKYHSGPGLHIPRGVAIYTDATFTWTTTDPWPDTTAKTYPRESVDQT
jgi:hypothetical protein